MRLWWDNFNRERGTKNKRTDPAMWKRKGYKFHQQSNQEEKRAPLAPKRGEEKSSFEQEGKKDGRMCRECAGMVSRGVL